MVAQSPGQDAPAAWPRVVVVDDQRLTGQHDLAGDALSGAHVDARQFGEGACTDAEHEPLAVGVEQVDPRMGRGSADARARIACGRPGPSDRAARAPSRRAPADRGR